MALWFCDYGYSPSSDSDIGKMLGRASFEEIWDKPINIRKEEIHFSIE